MAYKNGGEKCNGYGAGTPGPQKTVQQFLDTLAAHEQIKVIKLPENWEGIKGRIQTRLVNYGWNRGLLGQVPHRRFLDLAAVAFLDVSGSDHCQVSLSVRYGFLQEWGITEEGLWAAAWENLEKEPYWIRPMGSLVEELGGEKPVQPEGMPEEYILGNRKLRFGAAGLLRKDLLEGFAREIGGGFYILPSSVHELLLLPGSYLASVKELEGTVREINWTKVEPSEWLSVNVYYYDWEMGEVRMAE